MFQDFRFALRLFRKHPGPAGIAMGGLGLAIGVVAAVFSIVNATLLKPYGMDDPNSVVNVTRAGHGGGFAEWSWTIFRAMQAQATLGQVEASLVEQLSFATTSSVDGASTRRVSFVSGGYLGMLGGRAAAGRTLEPADDAPAAPPVVVVSHHFWTTQLGADPAAIGTTVWLNGRTATLVGVLRRDFTGPVDYDMRPSIWAPFAAFDDLTGGLPIDRAGQQVEVIARLSSRDSMFAAEESLSAVVVRLRASPVDSHDPEASRPVRLVSAASPMDGPAEADVTFTLVAVFGVTGLVLAVACANTANLLLASAVTRRREMGVRLALGASRRRVVRQMVHESLLLGACAGGLGFALAIAIVPVFGAIVAMPPDVDLAPDARVLMFTVAVALVSGLGAGLSPARHGSRGNVLVALQAQGGSRGAASLPSRLRTTFVGFQAAVSILLLVVAAVLARAALVTARADMGFDPERLTTISLEPTRPGLDRQSYVRSAVAAVQSVPGVEGVSVGPIQGRRSEVSARGRSFELRTAHVDGEFFATAGVRLLRGRTFTSDEVSRTAEVAVISEAVARAFFAGSDPLGGSLIGVPAGSGRSQDPATIVGIAADSLMFRPGSHASGTIYRPLPSASEANVFTNSGYPMPPSLLMRSATPAQTGRAVVETLRRVDSSVTATPRLVLDSIESHVAGKRMLAWLAGPVAVLALFLAALGVYGVTAFVVGLRTEEIGIRLAIGATSADVRRLLVRDSLRPVLIGLGAGLVVALGTTRALSRALQISGISPNDPLSVGVAVATLLTFALAAVLVPARRAARMDPAGVLR
jgi:predicted permease